jgi:isopenicillin N synthase-like dioxygenase
MRVLTVDYGYASAPTLFCQSLKETGFAILRAHPIPTQLITQAYNEWRDFFSSDEKYQYCYQKPAQDGYFAFRTENAKDSKVGDLKEFFHFYPWGKKPPATKAASEEMYEALMRLAAELLQWIENFLPTAVAENLSMPLREMVDSRENTLLRILHYPPLSADMDSESVRAAPHEDINLITLLPAATAPGLEVLDREGNWHAVNCDPSNIVVNVGDMLQMCTQHYYKPTTHRVVNPGGQVENIARFSMPLFLHPRKEVRLSKDYTAVEYLHERLRQIGIY